MIRWRFFEPNPMRDVFEQMLREGTRWRESTRGEPMPINIHETEGEVIVEASLPGVKPENVEIHSSEGVLTIAASSVVEERDYHHQEIRSVTYHRQLLLPADARWEEAKADFEHGMLTIRIPKRQPKAPERIRIQVSRGSARAPIEATKGEGYSEVPSPAGDQPRRAPAGRSPRSRSTGSRGSSGGRNSGSSRKQS